MPLCVNTSESRAPVATSIPFMQSTKSLSATSYSRMRLTNPRKPCEEMEMMMISARVTASFKSQVKRIRLSKVTYSFLPVLFSTS